jgi:hypothetical protein
MKCHTNVNFTPPTQLPHTFSYIVAILIRNHFESPNTNIQNDKYKKTGLDAVSPFLIGIQAVSKAAAKTIQNMIMIKYAILNNKSFQKQKKRDYVGIETL